MPSPIILIMIMTLASGETPDPDALFDYDAAFGSSPRKDKDFMETAEYDGYDVEEHFVVTKDGYILRVFRMKRVCRCEGVDMEPLVWMHGLFLSADTCIIKGEDCQCYMYANCCFDVWIPNVRGNRYSRNHTTLDPDKDAEFWNYDFDKMAFLDLPAILDYILKVTCKTQVVYVAHSQGVTMMLVLCSLCPEYNAKVRVGFGMSTATWLDHSKVFILDIEAFLAPVIRLAGHFGFHAEILKYRGILSSLAYALCATTTLAYPICSAFVFAFFGYNNYEISPTVLVDTVGHEPSGSSTDNFERWGDVKRNGFRRKNLGIFGNLAEYGSKDPPGYPLQNVTMDWVFICSDNDGVSSPKDMETLTSKLVNCKYKKCHLRDPYFGHMDYILGKSSREYCAELVKAYLKNGTMICKGNVINSPLV